MIIHCVNISYNSKEIMRRIISTKLFWQIIRFNRLDEMIG